MKSTAERSLYFTGIFEAEVLVQLMLDHWKHPYSADPDFTNHLLEDAANILREAVETGIEAIEGLPPSDHNLIAAVWSAEHRTVDSGRDDPSTLEARKAWLHYVRRSLPSCFCDSDNLSI